jgi:hypothetical protein
VVQVPAIAELRIRISLLRRKPVVMRGLLLVPRHTSALLQA